MSVTTLTLGKLEKTHGWELADGACIITAQFQKLGSSTEFVLDDTTDPVTGEVTVTTKWSWAIRSDAQKLIDLIKERANFLGSTMDATANAGETINSAANFAKLQQVYTTATNIQYLLHPSYKEGENPLGSGISYTNRDFPTFAEINTSGGTIDEGSYHWWYELCKFAGLISTDSEGNVTWGFSYRNSSGNIVRPGSSGSGINALRVVTAGDAIEPVVNKLIIQELLALANIEHSQKIRIAHTGTPGAIQAFSNNNTVGNITVGTLDQRSRTSDCDAQKGLSSFDRWDTDCGLGSDGSGNNNPFGNDDVRGNHWFATNNAASINAITTPTKSKSAYCFSSINAKYKADCISSSSIGSGDTFMDLELEYAAAQLSISGSYSSGFVVSSRGQQTLSLGTDNVPIAITGYHIFINTLTDANQVFLGTKNDSTETTFDEGWNEVDISGKVTNGAVSTSNAGIAFIDNLIINPVEDASMLMTQVPQFVNDDFSKLTFSNVSLTFHDISDITTAEEDDCDFTVISGNISISVTDLDGTTVTPNYLSDPVQFLPNRGIQLEYTGNFAPNSVAKSNYTNYTSSPNSLLNQNNAGIIGLGVGVGSNQYTNGQSTLGAGSGGSSPSFTDSVVLKVSRDNIFEYSVGASSSYTITCNEAVSTTTTTTAEGGS